MAEGEDLLKGTSLHWGDILVIVAYFVIVIATGLLSSLRNRGSTKGYFLAGRSMHWIPVGASLFASNIGSGHFIGLAGSGAATGIGIAVFELNAIFILLLLGWVFVPVYVAAGVFTMPEYLKRRFGGQRIRVYLAVLALLLYIFTKISADLFAGATFINQALKWELYSSTVLLLAIAALFTITGGLTAVIWTDFIQTIIMIVGALILMVMGFVNVGGFEALIFKYPRALPNTTLARGSGPNRTHCGRPPDNFFHFFRPVTDGSYPWTGVVFGLTISSVWYWCSDQVIVQRALAAKNVANAKTGCILAGYLKFLPMWLMVFPGMIARVLFPDLVGCGDPAECKRICGSEAGCTNIAYPLLVLKLMPVGLRGLMMAVMMAALMSSLTSIFNSGSTIFTMDIWRRFRRNASEIELMIVGRCCVIVLVVIGVVWLPIVQNVSELFHYIQAITSYLAPPVCAVYVLAVLWKRCNEKGAFWGLMVGLVVGMIRFIWEFSYTVPPCGREDEDPRPDIIKKVHYLHFGIILFFITLFTSIIVSILTPEIPEECLYRLTFWTRFSTEERMNISEYEEKDVDPESGSKKKGRENEGIEASDTESKGASTADISTGVTDAEPEEDIPCYRKAFNWFCGIEKVADQPVLSEEEQKAIEAKQNSIHEDPLVKKIINVNAIVLMFVAIFLWGFYY